ncbi:MAG: AAA family ATPase [Gammaproteobacteria bacterium]
MKPSRLEVVLESLLDQRWPAFIWGPPGVGKSSLVHAIARRRTLDVVDLRASLLDPTDLRGIPAIEQGRAVWCPPAFLPQPRQRPGILFLDEINAAPPLVQASLYQLVLDRRVGEYVLPDGWWIVAAGNRQQDRAVTFRMSSALANRFVHLQFEADIDDWRSWAIGQGIDPLIIGFLGVRPSLLQQESGDSPAFATPRSWEMVSDILKQFGGVAGCRDVLPGIIGEGPAIELLKFAKQALQEKRLRELVDNPAGAALPKALDELYLITSWFASHGKEKTVVKAAGELLERLPPEFAVVMARDMLKASPAFVREPGYKEFLRKHGQLLVA